VLGIGLSKKRSQLIIIDETRPFANTKLHLSPSFSWCIIENYFAALSGTS
jgi:hypothetical protein